MEEMKKWTKSWPAIIITLIVFWPLGCFLIYYKFSTNNGKLKMNSILLILSAIGCFIMTAAGISITTEDLNNDFAINIFIVILFLSGGIVSTIFAIKSIKKYRCYNKYVEKIGARIKISIDELAEQTGDTIEKTIENVSGAIKYKMLDGYINQNGEVIITNKDNINTIEKKQEIVTVQCKNCGANNKFVIGEENRCEFCDSVLIRHYSNIVK